MQPHSVIRKQVRSHYPTQGPKHRHLHGAQLPWALSSQPYGLAGCHGPLRLLHPSHGPGPEHFQAMGPFASTESQNGRGWKGPLWVI